MPVHGISPAGTILWANRAELDLVGYPASEYVGQSVAMIHVDPALPDALLTRLSRGETVHDHEARLRTKNGSLRHVLVSASMQFRDGRPVSARCFSRDITLHKQADLERATAHTPETQRLHDEFVSLASHELRTPLTVLQLQLDAMRERADAHDRSLIAKLDRGDRACVRLAELVEALLDVSRLATGRFALTLAQAELADIVRAAIERLQDPARSVGCAITLAVEVPAMLGVWDRTRLEQVVSNLISNAFRHAAGTPIEITLTADSVSGDAVIEVRDRGPGLPDGDLGRLFERFERAASLRHVGGLGLGLYVVRRIVEAHGGQVTGRNREGGGACFTVRLPRGELAP